MIPENSLVNTALKKIEGHWVNCAIVELIFVGTILISSVVSFIVVGPLMVGKLYFYYNILNKGKASIEDMFSTLNSKIVIKSIIVMVLYIIGIMFFSLFLVIPGVIFALRYALVIFIVADNPDAKTEDIFRKSHEMMNGKKMELLKYLLLYGVIIVAINIFVSMFYTNENPMSFYYFHPLSAFMSNFFAIPINIIAMVTFILYYLGLKSNHISSSEVVEEDIKE